jgi:acyl-CoA synthetase (AMP-forming)/AMP-acid ligase II
MDPINFGELTWRATRLFPDRVAVVEEDTELTFGALDDRIRRVATVVRTAGIRRGEPALLLLPNDWRYPEALLGPIHAGAVAAPMNIRLADEMLAYIAKHSGARLLIAHSELADQAAKLAVDTTFFVDDPDWIAGIEPAAAPEAVEATDPAMLMYTSGSTGRPKGVLLAHRSKWWQARSTARCYMLTEDDRGLVTGPLYHANALWACLLPMLLVGGSVAIMPAWSADAMLAAIDRYRPSFTSGTPAMFTLLLNAWDEAPQFDLTSLKLIVCGSAPVPQELLDALQRRLDGVDVLESYGLTEGGANVLTPRWGIHKLGSTGLPVPGVELRVRPPDDPGRECEPEEVGELWTRSVANLIGYLKQPDVTAERLTGDGWLRTGDLVRRDEQGYVYFSGRVDDMINVGGENVYPKEVETILLEHPDVLDVCVVGAPHRVKGAAPVAWVVPRDPSLSEEAVKQFFIARGPAYAHPRRVFFVEQLPVTGTNKLDRTFLQNEAVRLVEAELEPSTSNNDERA